LSITAPTDFGGRSYGNTKRATTTFVWATFTLQLWLLMIGFDRGPMLRQGFAGQAEGEKQSIPCVCTPAQRTGLNTTTGGASGRRVE